jgi:CPA1 family monovalent cation:H+ antiporter
MVSFWGGLRGAVALALALSLAADFPHRDLLIAMTLGVALFTIIGAGLTAGPLIHWFKLDKPEPVARLEAAQARFLTQQSALTRLGELQVWQPVFPAVFSGSEQFYAARLAQASHDLLQTWQGLAGPQDLTRRAVWHQALDMEKCGYREGHDDDILSPRTFDRLNLMLNLKNDAISADQIPPPALTSEGLEEFLDKRLAGIWRWFGRGRRQIDQAVREHYAFNLAVALVGKRVAEELQQLAQQLAGQLDPALFETCATWYADRSQEMFQHLQAQEAQHPQLFQAIQQHFLQQALLVSARGRLAQLFTDGIVSPAAGKQLAEELDSEGNSP